MTPYKHITNLIPLSHDQTAYRCLARSLGRSGFGSHSSRCCWRWHVFGAATPCSLALLTRKYMIYGLSERCNARSGLVRRLWFPFRYCRSIMMAELHFIRQVQGSVRQAALQGTSQISDKAGDIGLGWPIAQPRRQRVWTIIRPFPVMDFVWSQ